MKPNKLTPRGAREPVPDGHRHMILLIVNTVFFIALYYLIPLLGFRYMPFIYLAIGTASALWFVIYNRGFNTRGKTPEMLPEEIPFAEREAMIAEGKRRFDKSKWILTVILPVIFTILIDIIYLFLIPEGLFS